MLKNQINKVIFKPHHSCVVFVSRFSEDDVGKQPISNAFYSYKDTLLVSKSLAFKNIATVQRF